MSPRGPEKPCVPEIDHKTFAARLVEDDVLGADIPARRLAGELPDRTAVYPTHGFGSFCSATQSGGTASTIGQGLDAFPAYYAHMGPVNAAGPDEADLSLPPS